MKTLLLVRHAHTLMAGRFCGHSDPELSETGQGQLPAIVERVWRWPVSCVCASDLRRAFETAQAIARLGKLQIEARPALREIYFGDWENKSWEEIATRDPATAAAWLIAWPHHAAPGGESFGHFVERVKDELNALAGRRYGPCTVAITHAGFIAVAVSMVTGKPIASVRQPAYGDVLEFQRFGDTWILRDKS